MSESEWIFFGTVMSLRLRRTSDLNVAVEGRFPAYGALLTSVPAFSYQFKMISEPPTAHSEPQLEDLTISCRTSALVFFNPVS